MSSEHLSSLAPVVHDGRKGKAAASGKSLHREKTLRAPLEAAREKVEKLEQALKALEKVPAAGRG